MRLRNITGADVYIENSEFVVQDFKGQKGNWKEVDCKQDAIPVGFAPQLIYDYITANFPTNFISKISHNCHGYDVELNNDLELKFDKNGNFKRIDD